MYPSFLATSGTCVANIIAIASPSKNQYFLSSCRDTVFAFWVKFLTLLPELGSSWYSFDKGDGRYETLGIWWMVASLANEFLVLSLFSCMARRKMPRARDGEDRGVERFHRMIRLSYLYNRKKVKQKKRYEKKVPFWRKFATLGCTCYFERMRRGSTMGEERRAGGGARDVFGMEHQQHTQEKR